MDRKTDRNFQEQLDRWNQGDRDALRALFDLSFQPRLIAIATNILRKERQWDLLDAAELVSRAWLVLRSWERQRVPDEAAFYRAAEKAMKREFLDLIKAEKADKRGGKEAVRNRVPLEKVMSWLD